MSFYGTSPSLSGILAFSTFGSFPAATTVGAGTLAIALDTQIMYVSTGAAWVAIASPGAGSAISALTGDVTATGPGSVPATLAATSNATLTTLSALTSAASLATIGTIVTGVWHGTTIAIANGGTGATTKAAAFDALQPMTTAGDIIYGGAAGTGTRLPAGGATQVLHSGATPSWSQIALGTDVSGTLPVGNGGTGLASGSSGGILGFTGATTLASSAPLTLNGVLYGGGAGATPNATGAGTADQVLVIPHAGGAPAFGQVDLSLSAAVKNQLGVTNGGTGSNTAAGARSNLSAAQSGVNADITSLTMLSGTTGILGNASGAVASAGYVAEVLTLQLLRSSALALSNTATPVSLTGASALSLTAGRWRISGSVGFSGSATATTSFRVQITTSSSGAFGNIPSGVIGLTDGGTGLDVAGTASSAMYNLGTIDGTLTISPFDLSSGSSQSLYMGVAATFPAGTVSAYGKIVAERLV